MAPRHNSCPLSPSWLLGTAAAVFPWPSASASSCRRRRAAWRGRRSAAAAAALGLVWLRSAPAGGVPRSRACDAEERDRGKAATP